MKKRLAISVVTFLAVAIAWARVPAPDQQPRVVRITAKRFEFVPSQVTLKKGEPVVLQLTSEDVTHGFFVRPLRIDEDIPAGQTKQIALTPQVAGKFTTICDHFCGVNHGAMHMTIEVVE